MCVVRSQGHQSLFDGHSIRCHLLHIDPVTPTQIGYVYIIFQVHHPDLQPSASTASPAFPSKCRPASGIGSRPYCTPLFTKPDLLAQSFGFSNAPSESFQFRMFIKEVRRPCPLFAQAFMIPTSWPPYASKWICHRPPTSFLRPNPMRQIAGSSRCQDFIVRSNATC
jgi:hypothetical protein